MLRASGARQEEVAPGDMGVNRSESYLVVKDEVRTGAPDVLLTRPFTMDVSE